MNKTTNIDGSGVKVGVLELYKIDTLVNEIDSTNLISNESISSFELTTLIFILITYTFF